MQFVMRLAREFRRADWRRMLSEMSATELGEWGDYFRMQSFSDVWMDAQFASLKALIVRMVSGSSDAAVADFSLVDLLVVCHLVGSLFALDLVLK